MNRRLLQVVVVAALVVVTLISLNYTPAPAPAAAGGGCLCPDIYAPVICSNGKTYPNLCVATCQKARNCVPTGGI